VNERFAFDLDLAGRVTVAGADEAGRGCLAGPLVTAAVCLDYARLGDDDFAALEDLDDSKKLTRERRAELYDEIMRRALQVTVVSCSPASIDGRGLHRCNLQGLAESLDALSPRPAVSLVDGFRLPGCASEHQAIVGGDGKSAAIAAASVVAKVTRDRVMIRVHERFPQYGFDRHVGYATAAHREAIETHGACELHRLSFASVAYRQLDLLGHVQGEPAPDPLVADGLDPGVLDPGGLGPDGSEPDVLEKEGPDAR
jgi:ribonuclease HII